MIRNNTFEKKYALLAPFIKNPNVRNNMMSNKDLYEKYSSNYFLIKAYLEEIKNRFDEETINDLIIETIFKLPQELLRSFITAYLNSSEITKNNSNALIFYKKSLTYGNDVIKYIEENGIITNREYKNLPKILVEKKFNNLITNKIYKYGESNILIFENILTIQEKSLLIMFLESNNFEVLDLLFSNYMDLKKLLSFLNATGININILNKKNLELFGEKNLLFITMINFSMLGDNNLKNNIETIQLLLDKKRIDLITTLVENNSLKYAYALNNETLDTISCDEMMKTIVSHRYVLEKAA